ncbi:MAG: DMT family transporter [Rhizomicrobium sp.]
MFKSLFRSAPLRGAAYMVTAGVLFALINILTQWLALHYHYPSMALAFWQYGLALVFFLPLLIRHGVRAFHTTRPWHHILRVVLATIGVQFFVAALTHGVAIWQVVALDMTSPFLVILGAHLFLGEKIGIRRGLAAMVGFAGGMLILAPWSTTFTLYSLFPLGSAAMWAAFSLMTKSFVATEKPEAVTVYLLALLTPINAVFLAAGGGFALAAFAPPTGTILGIIVALGALTAVSQALLTRAYASADAAFLQPFDNIRLPLNIAASYLVFATAPHGYLWLGAGLIVLASLSLLKAEAK